MDHRLDYHTAFAARAFGVPHEAVTRLQREAVKLYNFGALYGMGEFVGEVRDVEINLEKGENK